jgi:glycerol kinase
VILAVDQGTTGTTCLVVDDELRVAARSYVPVSVSTPRPGWVEQDPWELWASVERAIADAGAVTVDAVGIANQRETTIVWDRRTGDPVYPAIVWQDRRTADRCRELDADLVRARTGLTPDPYFSATKLEWILREASGDLAFGTVDTWLLWQLTGGAVHATDVTNASRTMLLDLETLDWSDELLDLFGVPRSVLPEIHPSAHAFGGGVAALAGDQQASLYAHGGAKATIGTGAFVLVPTSWAPPPHGLLLTAAADGGYALEGSVFVAGAAVQWLRDGLAVVADATETEALARSVDSTAGVYFVPALTGLGSPHWNPHARGLITGITRGTRREHLVRAALESIAYQILDVVDALPQRPAELRVDGGAAVNSWLMQFLADVLQMQIHVALQHEMTALGAAALAGISTGKWTSSDLVALRSSATYDPERDVSALVAGWRDAVGRAVA